MVTIVENRRGPAAILDRRGAAVMIFSPENSAEAQRQAERASGSAAIAEAFSGPTYADQAAGEAATTDGDYFAVNSAGIVSIYLRTVGGSTLQRTMVTTAALAASGGAAMVGKVGGGTLQDVADDVVTLQADIAGLGAITPYIETLLDDANAATARSTLGLAIGTDVQAYDADLAAIAGAGADIDEVPYFTGPGAVALMTVTAFMRTLLDDVDADTAMLTLGALSLVSVTFGANTISLKITLNSTNDLLIQGGKGSIGANNASTTITFPTAYSVAPVVIVSGGATSASIEGSVSQRSDATTTGIPIVNSGAAISVYSWFAIGKA